MKPPPLVLRVLREALFFLALAAGGLAFITCGTAIDAWKIHSHRNEYLDREFTVTGAHYNVEGSGDNAMVTFWLEGLVEGRPEKLITYKLGNMRSKDEIAAAYPTGTVIRVKYHPQMGEANHSYSPLRIIESGEFHSRASGPMGWFAGLVLLCLGSATGWFLLRLRLARTVESELGMRAPPVRPAEATAAEPSAGVGRNLSLAGGELRNIRRTEHAGVLRLDWSNRHVRKDNVTFWFMVVFWMVWAPLTVFATYMIFYSDSSVFFTIWCLFGWLGTLAIPYALLQRWSSEWIEISARGVTCGHSGFLAGKPRTNALADITEIGLGCHDDESMVTLNIHCRGQRRPWLRRALLFWLAPEMRGRPELQEQAAQSVSTRRYMFGYWLSPELKEQVFEVIREFAGRNNLPLVFKTYCHPA